MCGKKKASKKGVSSSKKKAMFKGSIKDSVKDFDKILELDSGFYSIYFHKKALASKRIYGNAEKKKIVIDMFECYMGHDFKDF